MPPLHPVADHMSGQPMETGAGRYAPLCRHRCRLGRIRRAGRSLRSQAGVHILHHVHVGDGHRSGGVQQLRVVLDIRVPECGRHVRRISVGLHSGRRNGRTEQTRTHWHRAELFLFGRRSGRRSARLAAGRLGAAAADCVRSAAAVCVVLLVCAGIGAMAAGQAEHLQSGKNHPACGHREWCRAVRQHTAGV